MSRNAVISPAPMSAAITLTQGDGRRIFLTAFLIYAVFWNPFLDSSMIWTIIDATVSFVNTGCWELMYRDLYGSVDLAFYDGRYLPKQPPGLSFLIMPIYLVWRLFGGAADTVTSFQSINACSALFLGASASAMLAVASARLAAQFGANRRAQIWTAMIVAFGTQNFFFGTTLFKENFVALAIVIGFRLAFSQNASSNRVTLAGFVTSLAATISYQSALVVPVIIAALWFGHGFRRAFGFLLGSLPVSAALLLFTTLLFGSPFITGHGHDPSGTPETFVIPEMGVLYGMILGVDGGQLLYAPFLVMGFLGLVRLWSAGFRAEAACIIGIAGGYWLVCSSFISSMTSQGGWQGSWTFGLGQRFLFSMVPLLAAVAGATLIYFSKRLILILSAVSLFFGYLNAQAGFMACGQSFIYAMKTFLSGFGMGIFFKEALPKWLGWETVTTYIDRPEIHPADLWQLLVAGEGWKMVLRQGLLFSLNIVVLALVGWAIYRIWRESGLLKC